MFSHAGATSNTLDIPPATKRNTFFLTTLFFVSGLSALIHETAWSHYLRLLLGHAALSQAVSIISFMGGLAAGAFIASRYNRYISQPLLVYAFIELAIGIYALSFHAMFVGTIELLHFSLAPGNTLAGGITILKFFWAFLLTFPAAMLIGMTFPVMSAVFLRQNTTAPEKSLSILYFSNSIGAAIGTLLCGFVLINYYGLASAMLTAGVLNICIAICSYLILPRTTRPSTPSKTGSKIPINKLFIIVAFITGSTSFLYEISWIRLLNLLLGSSDYSFELILSSYITGIALGAAWLHARNINPRTTLRYLAYIQLGMGLLAALSINTYDYAYNTQAYLVDNLAKNQLGFFLYNTSSLFISYAVVVPTTFMAGMTLPLLTAICIRRGNNEDAVGAIYGWNTIGAITGILLGSYILMPMIGAINIIYLGAIGDVFLGVVLLAYYHRTVTAKSVIIISTIIITCLQLLYMYSSPDLARISSGVYRYGSTSTEGNNRLLYYRDGRSSTVSVLLDDTGRVQLKTNGKTDATAMRYGTATTLDEPTMTLLAIVPMALRPQSQRVANIGFGSGITTQALLLMPSISQVDTIEIEPAVIEAAQQFGKHSNLAYTDIRSNIILDDARSYFALSPQKYDLIISEPSNPWVSGVATIFSEEFYRLISKSLMDDGIFVQWLHLYESNDQLVSSVFNAIHNRFNDYLVFSTTDSDILIVASNSPIPHRFSNELFANPTLANVLKRINIEGVDDLNIRILGTRSTLGALLTDEEVPTNSDYTPFVSRTAPYTFFVRSTAQTLMSAHTNPLRAISSTESFSEIFRATPSPYFAPSRNPTTAMLIYRYFVDDLPHGIGGSLPLMHAMHYVKSSLSSCHDNYDNRILQNSLFEIAINTTPFLSEKDNKDFWGAVTSSSCLETIPIDVSLWLHLHSAIAHANPQKIIDVGVQLLALSLPASTAEIDYLIGGMIIAYQMNGQTEEANKLWRTMQRYYENRVPPLYLRIIINHLQNSALP